MKCWFSQFRTISSLNNDSLLLKGECYTVKSDSLSTFIFLELCYIFIQIWSGVIRRITFNLQLETHWYFYEFPYETFSLLHPKKKNIICSHLDHQVPSLAYNLIGNIHMLPCSSYYFINYLCVIIILIVDI